MNAKKPANARSPYRIEPRTARADGRAVLRAAAITPKIAAARANRAPAFQKGASSLLVKRMATRFVPTSATRVTKAATVRHGMVAVRGVMGEGRRSRTPRAGPPRRLAHPRAA